MELDTLQNLKKSLKKFLTRLSIGGIQNLVSWPEMFPDIPESMITERIRYLYKKHERSLLEVYGNPVDGLMGLINNQILLVSHQITMIKEIMSPVPSDESPPGGEYIPEKYSPNYAPRYV